MKSIFQARKEFPFHVSVGAVLTNAQGQVCCHFYKKSDLPIESEGKSDLYLLMRETIESEETIEHALLRGIKEEFGATGEIRAYLGSLISFFPLRISKVSVQKTTLYFHITVKDFLPGERAQDEVESKSEILWLDPHNLVDIFRDQGKKYDRSDLDESEIIERYISYGKS